MEKTSIALQQELASGNDLVFEGHLDHARRPDLLDVLPVELLQIELLGVELQRLLVHGDDLTLEPFARGHLHPVEVVGHRWRRLPASVGVIRDRRNRRHEARAEDDRERGQNRFRELCAHHLLQKMFRLQSRCLIIAPHSFRVPHAR